MRALMEHNIELNGLAGRVEAAVLNWGEPLPPAIRASPPDVVLAADCVYFEPAFPLLLATLSDLLQLRPSRRSPSSPFSSGEAGAGSPEGAGDNEKQGGKAVKAGEEERANADGEGVVVYFCFKKRRRADLRFLARARKLFRVEEPPDAERAAFSRDGLFLYTFRAR
ncbi:putative methyltransferase-domain-containing protein [Durotheca rogersii]|uniref:putative methyltransferase-domain-containing protein n=1 Tax=Durotheca rogersii TaxID=419775 RepID=UPI00221F5DC5|nr:putative methyltransferase-domain-containing protein [Durotheca rogersii]KAI5859713.1 putative methyltransferase-domain-containing protein [Durotheca rogersii]